MSGQYGGRDEACPVSTGGGTRRVRSVRGEGRGVSGQYGANLSHNIGSRRTRTKKQTHLPNWLSPGLHTSRQSLNRYKCLQRHTTLTARTIPLTAMTEESTVPLGTARFAQGEKGYVEVGDGGRKMGAACIQPGQTPEISRRRAGILAPPAPTAHPVAPPARGWR